MVTKDVRREENKRIKQGWVDRPTPSIHNGPAGAPAIIGRVLRTTVRPSAAVSTSAGSPSPGADAVREDKEPRPARRQLSRFLLCVTGSWKRSCGSSCSLADERLQRRERARNRKVVTVQVPLKIQQHFSSSYLIMSLSFLLKSFKTIHLSSPITIIILQNVRSVIVCVVMATTVYSFDM